MGNLSQKVLAALASKAAIKAAIEAKGVTGVGNVLSQYAAKIAEIPTGGGGGPHGDTAHLVEWIDFDGTVLKEEWVENGEAATAPKASEMPEHEHLIFKEWNHDASSYASVTHDMVIGATYDTEDNLFWLRIRAKAGDLVKIGYDGESTSHNWGDGTIDTSNTHTYSEDFAGFVSVGGIHFPMYKDSYSRKAVVEEVYIPSTCTDSVTFSINGDLEKVSTAGTGNLTFATYRLKAVVVPKGVRTITADNNFSLEKISIPEGVTSVLFKSCASLRKVILPTTVTSLPNNCFKECYSLTTIHIPSSVRSIGTNCFQACYALKELNLPVGITNLPNYAINACRGLRKLILPEGLTTIENYNIGLFSLEEIIIPSTVNSVGNSFYGNTEYNSVRRIKILSPGFTFGLDAFKGGISSFASLYAVEIPQGFVWKNTAVFQYSPNWTRDTMVAFFTNLGQTTTSVTLNFGADNLAKLSAEDKAIATGKGYTLT